MPASKKSKAPAVPTPQSDEEARGLMAMIGTMERQIGTINADMSERVSRLKEEAEKRAEPVKQDLDAARRGLQAWAEAHRARLTDKGKRKFFDLGTGTVRWRQRPPSVAIRGKDAVMEACRSLGLMKFIRTKEEINKEAMLHDPDAAKAIQGVTIKSAGEEFVIEPVSEELSKGEAA